ncbi:estradiol 17-beta-dehydrogenase 2 [Xyrichtys novacula]|uniref:Estradiol 17-beta-dehydrogenase 2 n=1 Tax=Xyrichtys novacula TaxID=13765 RepID=A0AAV1F3C9_XYRNO|nr:estradiol 17-beta-dehydrogenase 2 [Xyrichtys novacula]
MEITACFCAVAAAVYVLALTRWLNSGGSAGLQLAGTCGSFGSFLYFTLDPGPCGVLLLCFSFFLIRVTKRRDELLLLPARQLREQGRENLHVLQLDVTDSAQIEAAHRYVSAQVEDSGLWGLVNNAGVLLCPTDAELHPLTWYRRCMEVNFLSAVRMCQVFLPLLRRSRGRIVNVTSMAGEVPMPMFASYGASKAALSLFSKVMRMEMSEWGVHVALVQPSGFRTKIFGNSEDVSRNRDQIFAAATPEAREDYGTTYILSLPSLPFKMSQQTSEDLSPVVEDMRHALLSVRPRLLYTPGQMAWLLPFLRRCCPTAGFESLVWRLFRMVDLKPAGLKTS